MFFAKSAIFDKMLVDQSNYPTVLNIIDAFIQQQQSADSIIRVGSRHIIVTLIPQFAREP